MRAKLGLGDARGADPTADDETVAALAAELLHELHEGRIDYTRAFRALAETARGVAATGYAELLGERSPGPWLERWLALGPDPTAMDATNPVYIARNHLVDEALVAATEGDLAPFEAILDAVARPFEPRQGLERYAQPGPPGRPHVTYCGT
jgi:uncharacterized protein YdiU (UPF0061 family)